MKNILQNRDSWFILGVSFLLLIVLGYNRVTYIEDPDSLRFALAFKNFDPANGIPHFPIYPVYIAITKLFYWINNSLSFAPTVVNWFSTTIIALIIYDWSKSRWLSVFTIFQAGLILMATRYMPDVFGVSLVLLALYFTVKRENIYLALIASVLLLGVRLSYFPCLIPVIWHFFRADWKKSILVLVGGNLLILVGLLMFISFDDLTEVALKQTDGHFNDFGGGITSEEASFFQRVKFFFYRLFVNGFGIIPEFKYWQGPFVLLAFISGMFYILKAKISLNKPLLLAIGFYSVWILLFQNIEFKFRHVIPLIPLIILLINEGLRKINLMFKIIILLAVVINSVSLLEEHKEPTSIAQVVRFVKFDKPDVVISSKLLNYMLVAQSEEVETWNLEAIKSDARKLEKGEKVYLIGDFDFFEDQEIIEEKIFLHNEYGNPMWSELRIRKYVID